MILLLNLDVVGFSYQQSSGMLVGGGGVVGFAWKCGSLIILCPWFLRVCIINKHVDTTRIVTKRGWEGQGVLGVCCNVFKGSTKDAELCHRHVMMLSIPQN